MTSLSGYRSPTTFLSATSQSSSQALTFSSHESSPQNGTNTSTTLPQPTPRSRIMWQSMEVDEDDFKYLMFARRYTAVLSWKILSTIISLVSFVGILIVISTTNSNYNYNSYNSYSYSVVEMIMSLDGTIGSLCVYFSCKGTYSQFKKCICCTLPQTQLQHCMNISKIHVNHENNIQKNNGNGNRNDSPNRNKIGVNSHRESVDTNTSTTGDRERLSIDMNANMSSMYGTSTGVGGSRSRSGFNNNTSRTMHSMNPSIATMISATSDFISSPLSGTSIVIRHVEYQNYVEKHENLHDVTFSQQGQTRVFGQQTKNKGKTHMIGPWCIEDETECLIGKGAFSRVYKAIDYNFIHINNYNDDNTDKQNSDSKNDDSVFVAIKLIDNSDKSEKKLNETQWLAKNEIECLKKVSHENVVKLLGYNSNEKFNDKDVISFILEYAPNGNLRDLVCKLKGLPDILARTYLHQIISGLDACHKAGVVHRDLKLDNIVLDFHYGAKICDFGLAKVKLNFVCFQINSLYLCVICVVSTFLCLQSVLSFTYCFLFFCLLFFVCCQLTPDLTIKCHCVGTRVFRAPEVTMMENYNQMCDIFSAGVILFVMLANNVPFSRVVKKDDKENNGFVLDSVYKLFRTNNNQYWTKFVGNSQNINLSVKQIIYSMLEYHPYQRITIPKIATNHWYNKPIIQSSIQLKSTIESLLIKLTTITNKVDNKPNTNEKTKPISKHNKFKYKQRSDTKSDDISTKQHVHPIYQGHLPTLPIWVNDTIAMAPVVDHHYHTTTHWHLVYDEITKYVQLNLGGNVKYHKKSQTLQCIVDSHVEYDLTMFESNKRHVGIQLDRARDESDDGDSKMFIAVLRMTKGHLTQEQLDRVHREIGDVITGIPTNTKNTKNTTKSNSVNDVRVAADNRSVANLVTINERTEMEKVKSISNPEKTKVNSHVKVASRNSTSINMKKTGISSLLTGMSQISSIMLSTNNEIKDIKYTISNPLIIMLGIGDYDSDVMASLVGVSKDYINIISTFFKLGYCILYQNKSNTIEYIDKYDNTKTKKQRKKLDLRKCKENVKTYWIDDEIEDFFDNGKEYVVKYNHDSCIFLLSCHGDSQGVILDSQGAELSLLSIFSRYNGSQCQYLVDKPKIIFVDACRGSIRSQPIETLSKKTNSNNYNANTTNDNNHHGLDSKTNSQDLDIQGEIENKLNGDFASALADIGVSRDTHSENKVVLGSQYDDEKKRDEAIDNDDHDKMKENMIKIEGNWYHSQANFRYIYANPEGYAASDGGIQGGYLIRAIKRVFSNHEISCKQNLNDIIHLIRCVTKEMSGKGTVECVEDVSTMTYKVVFQKRVLD